MKRHVFCDKAGQMTGCGDGKTIDGSPVVRIVAGDYTGDKRYVTADGNVWNVYQTGVPTTIPSGTVIGTQDRQ